MASTLSLIILFTLSRELTSTVLGIPEIVCLLLRRYLACLQRFLRKPGVGFHEQTQFAYRVGRSIYLPGVLQFLSHPGSQEGVMPCPGTPPTSSHARLRCHQTPAVFWPSGEWPGKHYATRRHCRALLCGSRQARAKEVCLTAGQTAVHALHPNRTCKGIPGQNAASVPRRW